MNRSLRLLIVALAVAVACTGEKPGTVPSTRLVDLFAKAEVIGSNEEVAPPRQRIEWSFAAGAAPAAGPAWDAHSGVASLAVRDGGLAGRSTTTMPIIHVARDADPADDDPLYAVELRARVSAGANLGVHFSGDPPPPAEQLSSDFELQSWGHSPLKPGTDFVTYTMTSPNLLSGSGIRHVFVRPTDVAGADFAIESVRLVFRSEQLAAIKSGVSWQGLGEIYRETVVARAPDQIRFSGLALPADGWLDLALGTITGHPVTFHVRLEADGETSRCSSARSLRRTSGSRSTSISPESAAATQRSSSPSSPTLRAPSGSGARRRSAAAVRRRPPPSCRDWPTGPSSRRRA